MEKAVTVERAGQVATIQLNRPESLNAINLQLSEELGAAIAAAGRDPEVRAVIITGMGRAFCAGGDVKYFAAWEGPKPELFGALIPKLNRLIMDLRQMPKPVIAAINGVTSGAGLSLAMACDLRIASEGAKFKQAYTSIGLTPDGGWTLTVPRQIGMAKAAELLLLDPVLTAGEALSLGLINQVAPPEELMERARQLAETVVSRPAFAFAQSKRLLNKALGFGLAEQLEAERESIMAASDTSDFEDRLSAFLGNRDS